MAAVKVTKNKLKESNIRIVDTYTVIRNGVELAKLSFDEVT
jgi:hypothetical protein